MTRRLRSIATGILLAWAGAWIGSYVGLFLVRQVYGSLVLTSAQLTSARALVYGTAAAGGIGALTWYVRRRRQARRAVVAA